MANLTGLGAGIERGLRIGQYLDQRQQNEEDRAFQRQAQEQRLALSQLQLETLQDKNKRDELRRDNDAVLYFLAGTENDPAAMAKGLQQNPDLAKSLHQSLRNVANFGLADTGKAGQVDVIDLQPQGTNENGDAVFSLAVKTKDGKQSYITQNREAMSTGDKPQLFTLDELGQNAAYVDWLTKNVDANRKGLVKSLEAQQVGLGDAGPMERMRASASEASKRQHEMALALIKKGEKLYKISEDPMTGEIQYGRLVNGQIVPLGDTANPFEKLPGNEQDAIAIESLKQQRINPEQSTFFGLGDPKYSNQQIDAEKARLKMQGIGPGEATPGGINAPKETTTPGAQPGSPQTSPPGTGYENRIKLPNGEVRWRDPANGKAYTRLPNGEVRELVTPQTAPQPTPQQAPPTAPQQAPPTPFERSAMSREILPAVKPLVDKAIAWLEKVPGSAKSATAANEVKFRLKASAEGSLPVKIDPEMIITALPGLNKSEQRQALQYLVTNNPDVYSRYFGIGAAQ